MSRSRLTSPAHSGKIAADRDMPLTHVIEDTLAERYGPGK